MDENEIPGMDDFGKKLAAEIDTRKAAATEKKAQSNLKEQTSETNHDLQ